MDRQEWLKWRQKGITGTDISAIMGLNPWKSASDVWKEKKGIASQVEENKAMQRGKTLEPIVLDIYEKDKGLKGLKRGVFLEHPKFPHHKGSLDALIEDDKIILEVKCPNLFGFKKIDPSDPLDSIPIYYHLQIQWYMHLLPDSGQGRFLYFCADSWDYKDIPVEKDPVLEEEMVEAAEKFWKDYLPQDTLPEDLIQADMEAGLILPPKTGADKTEPAILKGPGWQWAAQEYKEAFKSYKAAQERFNQADAAIKYLLHKLGCPKEAQGFGLRIRHSIFDRTQFQSKLFKAEQPDIYQKYITKKTTSRTTIKIVEEEG